MIIFFTGILTCYLVSWSVTYFPALYAVTCIPALYAVTCIPALYAVTWIYILMYSWFLIMVYPCYSRKLIILNKLQLVLGRGKYADIDMCSCLQWLLGVLCNPCSGLTCGPPGDRGEKLDPFIFGTMKKGIHKSLMFSLAAGFRAPSSGTIMWPLSRVCTGSTVNIVRWYNRYFR